MMLNLILCIFLIVVTMGYGCAESYPDKSIRVLIPYAPGGGNDLTARILSNRLRETMGVSFVIDNRPGATGIIAVQLLQRAPADGYTLILVDAPFAVNPYTYKAARYDPVKDFSPISQVGRTAIIMVVHPSVPAQSLNEFIAYAKAHPDKLSMASGGTGTISHLTGELLRARTGIPLNHVPYKGGGPARIDVVSGQVQFMFASAAAAVPMVRSDKLRPLAISSEKRSSAFPDVPTFEEGGVAGFHVYNWYGVLAPAETPRQIVARLNGAIAEALKNPAIRERFATSLIEPAGTSAAQFADYLKSEAVRWAKLVASAGVKPE